jgi:hypothetical protein
MDKISYFSVTFAACGQEELSDIRPGYGRARCSNAEAASLLPEIFRVSWSTTRCSTLLHWSLNSRISGPYSFRLPQQSLYESLRKLNPRLHLLLRMQGHELVLIGMTYTPDPIEKHGPFFIKSAFIHILLQVQAYAVVALLPHPVPEENVTDGMKDCQVRQRKGGSISLCLQVLFSLGEPVPGLEQRLLALESLEGSTLREQAAFKAFIDILQWTHLSISLNCRPGNYRKADLLS